MPLMIDFFDKPHMTCYGKLFTDGRRAYYRTQFLRFAADSVFLILLKYRVEFIIINDTFTGYPDDYSALFRTLNMVDLKQVAKHYSKVVLRYPMKIIHRKYA